MRGARWVVAALILAGAPASALGQKSEGGRYEIGALASYNRFDPTRLGLADEFGAGLRAGWFLTRSFSVEAFASRTLTSQPTLGDGITLSEVGASALASVHAGGYNQIFAGVGYSWLSHSGAVRFDDHAVHGVLGDRIPLTRRAALRVDGRAIYTPKSNAPFGDGDKALNLSFSVGVSLFLGERPARDTDTDLVPDRFDLCASTPMAAIVDADGCPRDGDRDSVYDGLDRCPATPVGAPIDASGCALDTDGDGVADHLDRCPGTEAGRDVAGDGCPLDSDTDGVWDYLDACPGTPAGVSVDEVGCPRDEDADGVPDYMDRCRGTPAGQAVDDVGCPVLFEELEGQRQPLVLRGVSFELSSAILAEESFAVLDQVAASLVANPEVRVEVSGHTDSTGSDALNVDLSLSRAEAVRDYLVGQGVTPDRLVARGYGSAQPVADNATEDGRAQNRRVELRLIEEN